MMGEGAKIVNQLTISGLLIIFLNHSDINFFKWLSNETSFNHSNGTTMVEN